MTPSEFAHVVGRRVKLIDEVLGKKAAEYCRNNDRLHNFKRGAATLRETPEAYCTQLLFKHIVSILDMTDDLKLDICADAGAWEEKIGDAINYLILFEALIHERIDRTFDRTIQNQPIPKPKGDGA